MDAQPALNCSDAQICATSLKQEGTQSVQNGIPTRSMGTRVFFRTSIVPHAPAWQCLVCRSASQMRAAPYIHKSCGSQLLAKRPVQTPENRALDAPSSRALRTAARTPLAPDNHTTSRRILC
ncbi:hypothetical protein CCL23_28035 [Pseudomonas syringae]|nr:hypothetical protein CCL10_26865 [Pseudomonas syringae]PBQ01586.1 hypothetical protein CCL23_28035 [Pseudomonas syringae]